MPTSTEIKTYRNPFPTTDVIIEHYDQSSGKEGIVLITRRNPPLGLAIPGGFAEWGLSLEENAAKEGNEETGLEVIVQNPNHPFCVMSDPRRDPRGHMISIAYIATGYGRLKRGIHDDAWNPTLYTLPEVRDLIKQDKLVFDHGKILTEYLKVKGYG